MKYFFIEKPDLLSSVMVLILRDFISLLDLLAFFPKLDEDCGVSYYLYDDVFILEVAAV